MNTLLTKIRQEPTIFLFQKMWHFSNGNRKNVVLYVFFSVLANGVVLLSPLIFARFLNEIQHNGITSENIYLLCGIILLLPLVTLTHWVFHGSGRVLERANAFIVRKNYQQHLLDGVLNLNLGWHTDHDSGDTIDKINKSSDNLFDFSQSTNKSFKIVMRLIGTCIALSFFSIYIGVGVFLFVILLFLLLYQFDRHLVPQYKKLNVFANHISAKIFDTLSNITSVVILNIQKNVLDNTMVSVERPRSVFMRNVKLNEWKWFSGSIFFETILVSSILFYTLSQYNNNITVEVGTLSALYLYLRNLNRVFLIFSNVYEETIRRKAAVQNAQELEDAFTQKKEKQTRIKKFDEITITDLDFSYDTRNTDATHLDNIAMTIRAKERIAMIGASGSGKTTFLKVLHGLYPTVNETVHIDGTEAQTCLMHTDLGTTLVPQEPELFSASIRENITFGLDYSDKKIYAMTDLAHFTEVIEQLPRGLDSKVNEKGVNLSGGQKQRLALARALLFAQSKKIILLDESTSSVDPENEAKIYQDIFAHFEEKTIIASVHKMNLLKYFDRIIIFDNGKIIDEGTFDALLEKNKNFAQLWEEYSQEHTS